MIQIRPSSLDLLWHCTESHLPNDPGAIMVDQHSGAAEQGNAFHACAKHFDDDERIDAAGIAKIFKADREDLFILINQARQILDSVASIIGKGAPGVRLEEKLSAEADGITMSGTLDRFRITPERLYMLDWKTGRLDPRCFHQMCGYAWLAMKNHPGINEAWSACGLVRYGEIVAEVFTRDYIMNDWWPELVRRIRNGVNKSAFRPGAHCQYCPRQHTCDGAKAIIHSTVNELLPDRPLPLTVNGNGIDGSPELIGGELTDRLRKVKWLQSRCEQFIEAAREYVKKAGAVPTGDGRTLVIKTQKQDKIDPRTAWPVLRKRLSEDEIASALSISKGALVDMVKAKRPTGRGAPKVGEYINEFMAELDAVGALSQNEINMMREVQDEYTHAGR